MMSLKIAGPQTNTKVDTCETCSTIASVTRPVSPFQAASGSERIFFIDILSSRFSSSSKVCRIQISDSFLLKQKMSIFSLKDGKV